MIATARALKRTVANTPSHMPREATCYVCARSGHRGRAMHNYSVLAVLTILAGCAGPQASSGEYRSRASTDRLFAASLRAVPSVSYTVTSSNQADGLITAEQHVILGNGPAAGLTVIITRQGAESVLNVTFQAPPMTVALGRLDSTVAEYVAAVRSTVPDIHASAAP